MNGVHCLDMEGNLQWQKDLGAYEMRGEFVEWRMDDSGIQMASPTYCGGNLYFFERRRGIVRCVDAATGRVR